MAVVSDAFGLMPTNSPSPVSSDSFPEQDSFHFEQDLNEDLGQLDGSNQSKRKSRRPPSTAERRATHNAVERARRESLNGRFMDLAGALPNMASVKRPSKSVIVAKSLEFVQGAQAREQYLMGQNDTLRQEINELRARLGMAPLAGVSATMKPTSPALPIASRPRKSPSVSSSAGGNSPPMGTPASLGSAFDASPPVAAAYTFNTAYASAFPTATQAVAPPSAGLNSSTPVPVTQASYNRSAPALDVNYLMALSMQQQQQQNMLNMQNMAPSYSAVAPWMMPHASPIAAGGDNWLFN